MFGTFVLQHYNVISIVAGNVVGCNALQGIDEMTTLMDNTIEEMQFRCFLVHHIPIYHIPIFIYFDSKIKFLCNLEAELWTF